MHYFEFNKRDATIYSGATTSSRNTGLDEILEINKEVAENGTVQNISRILIDFDYSFISQSIQSGKIPLSAKYYLNLLRLSILYIVKDIFLHFVLQLRLVLLVFRQMCILTYTYSRLVD